VADARAGPDGLGWEWAVGIEDTFIGQPSGRRGRVLDEYELIDHYGQWRDDLKRLASLGVRSIRYGVPWYRVNPAPDRWDFDWTDAVVDHMARLGIRPIFDLVHYGTPLWLRRSFVAPDYPSRVGAYAARMAERYATVAGGWTPLNEPDVNAVFCGQRGIWPPHLRGDAGYHRVLAGIAEGIVEATAAIRAVHSHARIVAVEPFDLVTTDEPALQPLVADRWLTLTLPIDLVLGRVDAAHPRHDRLVAAGISPERLERLAQRARQVGPPDVLGVNFYPHMSRGRLVTARGTVRRRRAYATGEDLVRALRAYATHAHLPVMVTETSDVGSVQRRVAWMDASIGAIARARAGGLPIVGYTWFPVFSHVDWRWRRGPYERVAYWWHMGLWDIDEQMRRHRTPLAERYASYVAHGPPVVEAAA
jgi:beta-glucosidase